MWLKQCLHGNRLESTDFPTVLLSNTKLTTVPFLAFSWSLEAAAESSILVCSTELK